MCQPNKHSHNFLLAFAVAGICAQAQATTEDKDVEIVRVIAEKVVVRNHVNDTSPKLVYDAAYFQRFEPISVGDMLKRVPGVTFNSDVGEYDLPRLRGLDSKYTQVLINGRPIPGSENDGSIAVDRIPAELIEKIEIIRSPSADISSEGVGGSLNIVLKDGAKHQGGAWRVGAVHMEETRPSAYVGFSGTDGNINYGVALNIQERYNPKEKTSSEIDGDEREDVVESDVRDSTDIAFDGELGFKFDNGNDLQFRLYHVNTEREEEENAEVSAFERADGDSPFALDEIVQEHQLEEIEQQNTSFSTDFKLAREKLGTDIYFNIHQFTEEKTETNSEADLGDPLELDEVELTDIDDSTIKLGFKSTLELSSMEMRFGGEYHDRNREFNIAVFDDEGEIDDEDDEFADFEAQRNGFSAFIVGKWEFNTQSELEIGVRSEYDDLTVEGADFSGVTTEESEKEWQFNPSIHYRHHVSKNDQLRVSLARTVRRPQFEQLNPVALTIEDEIFRGNTALESEKSIGLDVGYDHFIDDLGVIGVNVFYRQVEDLIEFTQSEVVIGSDTFDLREPINNDNTGTIYGAELDVSAPASFIDLDNMQLFLNLTLLDSEVEDSTLEGLDRRFSGQAEYVYNIGLEHELKDLGMSYGFSFQQQGESKEFEGEEVNEINYDGNLEIFVEKRFANDDYVLRLSGQNLLDAEKKELKREFDDADAYRAGAFSTTETENEDTSPAIILTLRGRF